MTPDAEYIARSVLWYANQIAFHMIEAKPTARTQAALDELVKEGILTVEPYNQAGGKLYKKTGHFPFEQPATKKMHDSIGKGFTITEPV